MNTVWLCFLLLHCFCFVVSSWLASASDSLKYSLKCPHSAEPFTKLFVSVLCVRGIRGDFLELLQKRIQLFQLKLLSCQRLLLCFSARLTARDAGWVFDLLYTLYTEHPVNCRYTFKEVQKVSVDLEKRADHEFKRWEPKCSRLRVNLNLITLSQRCSYLCWTADLFMPVYVWRRMQMCGEWLNALSLLLLFIIPLFIVL